MIKEIPEIRLILADNVKKQRNMLGYSQSLLAEIAGLSVQTINDVEGGRKWVSDKTLEKLSGALGVKCYELLQSVCSEGKEVTKNTFELFKKVKKEIEKSIDRGFVEYMKVGE